ncbi:MAG TPA: hypothetical protein VMV05_02045 [bacterium]|nr:hypothetical protein [bacterium]
MKKILCLFLLVGLLYVPMTGCFTLKHTVGNGGQGTEVASNREWYILWGLIPLNKVDGEKMALENNLTNNYTVQSQMSFIDCLLNVVTSIVSVYGQTVSVSK